MMKIRKVFALFLIFKLVLSSLFPLVTHGNSNTVSLCYFYVNTCETCREAQDSIDSYIGNLRENNPGYDIRFFNYTIADTDGLELFKTYSGVYGVPLEKQLVPILFVGERFYSGEEEIENGLIETTALLKQGFLPELLISVGSAAGENKIMENFNAMKALNVMFIGFINGLNPCSLSMLLFFLSLLLARQGISVLKIGAAFLAGKFIAYILLGTLLYHFLTQINLSGYQLVMKIVLGLFILVMALLNIQDFFKARQEKYGEIKNQLPSKLRRWNHNIINKLSGIHNEAGLFAASFLLGGIISVGEFLCTGQVYLITIANVLQSESGAASKVLLWLVLYSLAFIIPSAIIIFIISRTRKLMILSEKLRNNLPALKLITAAILILTAVIALFIQLI